MGREPHVTSTWLRTVWDRDGNANVTSEWSPWVGSYSSQWSNEYRSVRPSTSRWLFSTLVAAR